MNLSAHFKLAEFVRSDKATELRIDNTPPLIIVDNLRILAQALEEVRAYLGGVPIKITSGYRNKAVNRAVGGSPSSAHMSGWAADFVAPRYGDPVMICKALARIPTLKFDQIISERRGKTRWVHFSVDPRARRQMFSWHDGVRIEGFR